MAGLVLLLYIGLPAGFAAYTLWATLAAWAGGREIQGRLHARFARFTSP